MPNNQEEHSPTDRGNKTGCSEERVASKSETPLASAGDKLRRVVQVAAVGTILVLLPLVFTPSLTWVVVCVFGLYVLIAVRFRRAPGRFAVFMAVLTSVMIVFLAMPWPRLVIESGWGTVNWAAIVLLQIVLIVGALRAEEKAKPTERRWPAAGVAAEVAPGWLRTVRGAIWLSLLFVVIAVVLATPRTLADPRMDVPGAWGIIQFLIIAFPYLLVLWLLRAKRERFAMAVAVGCGIVMGLPCLILAGMGYSLPSNVARSSGLSSVWPLLALLALVQAVLARSAEVVHSRLGGYSGYLGKSIIGILIGILVPVLGFVGISYVSDEALPRGQMGVGTNEAWAASSLRTISTANVTYSSTYKIGFAGSLAALGPSTGAGSSAAADLIDSTLAAGARSGYVFTYVAPGTPTREAPNLTYSVVATPASPGSSGVSTFCVDQNNVILIDTAGTSVSADETGCSSWVAETVRAM